MPRIAENAKSLAADIADRLSRVVAAARAEGRDAALAEIRSLVAGGAPVRRGPGRPRKSRNKPKSARSGKARRNPWAGLSPAARLARVNAIRKGRGLPLKDRW